MRSELRPLRARGLSLLLGSLVVLALSSVLLDSRSSRVELQSDDSLQHMQKEAEKEVVESAKRRYNALKHKEAAIKLAMSAEEDQTKARLLKRKSALAKKDAALAEAKKAVADQTAEIKVVKGKARKAKVEADKDSTKSDKASNDVMSLENKAGTYSDKASEERQKTKAVEKAAQSETVEIPKLLRQAEENERKAFQLKRVGRDKMDDSRRKTDEASRLDRVADEKEREAHMIRNRLIAILKGKTKMLDSEERDASKQQNLAKKGAKEAAAEAKRLAAQASAKANLAHKADIMTQKQLAQEREAEQLVRAEGDNVKKQLHMVASAKRDYEKAKQQSAWASPQTPGEGASDLEQKRRLEALKKQAVDSHRKVIEARRKANLAASARETAKVLSPEADAPKGPEESGSHGTGEPRGGKSEDQGARGSRTQVPRSLESRTEEAYDKERRLGALRGDSVEENGNGHLVVRSRRPAGPLDNRMKEDGHYSSREENFKKALAAAYRTGYEKEDDNFAKKPRARESEESRGYRAEESRGYEDEGSRGSEREESRHQSPERSRGYGGEGSGRDEAERRGGEGLKGGGPRDEEWQRGEGGEESRGRGTEALRGQEGRDERYRRDYRGYRGEDRGQGRYGGEERREGRGYRSQEGGYEARGATIVRATSPEELREARDQGYREAAMRGRGDEGHRDARGGRGYGREWREGDRRYGAEESEGRGAEGRRGYEEEGQGGQAAEGPRGYGVKSQRGYDESAYGHRSSRERRFEAALHEDTGRGAETRMHQALQNLATKVPSDSKKIEPPHYKPSRGWNHFWHRA